MEEQARELSLKELEREAFLDIFKNELVPLIDKENPNVISVGCGFAFESEPLLKLFPKAHFLGIDKSKDAITGAQSFNKDVMGDVRFEQRDARDIGSFEGAKWDIVILRNPQVLGSGIGGGSVIDWEKIVDNSLNAISEKGVIFISTMSPYESDKVHKLIEGKANIIREDSLGDNYPRIPDSALIIGRK